MLNIVTIILAGSKGEIKFEIHIYNQFFKKQKSF